MEVPLWAGPDGVFEFNTVWGVDVEGDAVAGVGNPGPVGMPALLDDDVNGEEPGFARVHAGQVGGRFDAQVRFAAHGLCLRCGRGCHHNQPQGPNRSFDDALHAFCPLATLAHPTRFARYCDSGSYHGHKHNPHGHRLIVTYEEKNAHQATIFDIQPALRPCSGGAAAADDRVQQVEYL